MRQLFSSAKLFAEIYFILRKKQLTTQFVGGTIALQLALANYNSKMSADIIDR